MTLNQSNDNSTNRAVASVAEHVEQLNLSRARFYELVKDGFFLPPIYSIANRRPLYLADMAERNRLAKETGIGIDGTVRVFYRRKKKLQASPAPTSRRQRHQQQQRNSIDRNLSEIHSALKRLGLDSVTEADVASTLAEMFPSGFDGVAIGEIIRCCFQRMRRSETAS